MGNDLNGVLKVAQKQYAQRKADAESRVARWAYFFNEAHDLRPFYFERFGIKPGRPLRTATRKAFAYGFDAAGQLAVVRQPKSREESAYEEFFVRESPRRTSSVAYATGSGHKVYYATRYDFDPRGRLIASDVLNAGGRDQFTERYAYRNGRLSEIEAVARSGNDRTTHRFDVQHDSVDGEFKVLRRYWDHLERFLPIHWNPAKAPTLESLGETIRTRLMERIPKVIAKAKVREPAYCIVLAYDAANDELPPMIGVGLESERQRWVASKGAKAASSLMWNPAEFLRYEDGTLSLNDDELTEACQTFCQIALSKSDLHSAVRLLCNVAGELGRRDWRGSLRVTDDFVVFPVDLEGDDLRKNMKACVPTAKLKRLKAQGFI
jgi:hypothetical protein